MLAMPNPLLEEIDSFLARTGMAETTFGKKALNDGKAIGRLRNGGRMWPETVEKLRGFMASQQPGAAA